MLVASLKRVRRRVQRLRYERMCLRQADPLADHPGLIVTLFYDVEGDYARAGQSGAEIATIERILRIERRCGIRSTYNVVARFAADAPGTIAAIRAAGHEIASHSYDHSILTHLSRAEIAENARRAKRTFAELGVDVQGHRSPQSDWDERVVGALVANGYTWSAEDGQEPHPYRLRQTLGSELWRFTVVDDDWPYESSGCTPAVMLERWQRRVREALGRRKHIAIGFHAWVEAAEERLEALEGFFHWLAGQTDVRTMAFGDVVRAMKASAVPTLAAADG